MKPKLPFLLMAAAWWLCSASFARAQSLSQQVVGAAGNEMLTPNLAFSYTIGEPCVTAWLTQNPIVTEGFQQNTVTITSVNETHAAQLNVYPNPFDESFVVEFNAALANPLLLITDALGRTVHTDVQRNASFAVVNMRNMPSGVYMLNVLQHGESLAVYRVVKTNP